MKTVLIIEDNFEIRENTAELLELEGYHVLTAPNGKAGHAMAKENRPHVILCDIMMPEMGGHELLKHLKQDTATANIPFIFVSASVERKEIQAGLDMGASGYLGKPFTQEDLVKELNRILEK